MPPSTIMATAVFTENHDLITVPLVAKLEKEAMAISIGMQWRHGATILTKFKLLNVISDQLLDCYVSVVMYYDIAIHQLVGNYV